MARKARARAQSGIYYIKIESANKLIFIDESDYDVFAAEMAKCTATDYAEVYAYRLDAERIDFVIKEGLGGVSAWVQRLLSAYTLYYNKRYARDGKLFYDRFKSMPLEEPTEVLRAVRHVLRLGQDINAHTSYAATVKGDLATDIVFLAGNAAAFKRFVADDDDFVGFDRKATTDEELYIAARDMVKGFTPERLDTEYDDILRKLLSLDGVTVGQLCRVLGVSRRRAERAYFFLEKKK